MLIMDFHYPYLFSNLLSYIIIRWTQNSCEFGPWNTSSMIEFYENWSNMKVIEKKGK